MEEFIYNNKSYKMSIRKLSEFIDNEHIKCSNKILNSDGSYTDCNNYLKGTAFISQYHKGISLNNMLCGSCLKSNNMKKVIHELNKDPEFKLMLSNNMRIRNEDPEFKKLVSETASKTLNNRWTSSEYTDWRINKNKQSSVNMTNLNNKNWNDINYCTEKSELMKRTNDFMKSDKLYTDLNSCSKVDGWNLKYITKYLDISPRDGSSSDLHKYLVKYSDWISCCSNNNFIEYFSNDLNLLNLTDYLNIGGFDGANIVNNLRKYYNSIDYKNCMYLRTLSAECNRYDANKHVITSLYYAKYENLDLFKFGLSNNVPGRKFWGDIDSGCTDYIIIRNFDNRYQAALVEYLTKLKYCIGISENFNPIDLDDLLNYINNYDISNYELTLKNLGVVYV